jgi:hypothetical protein
MRDGLLQERDVLGDEEQAEGEEPQFENREEPQEPADQKRMASGMRTVRFLGSRSHRIARATRPGTSSSSVSYA